MSAPFALPAGRADADRARTLLDLLGRPQDTAPVIVVAGGAGKTSVVRILGALLAGFGLKVGSYTAPHLQRLAERIRVAGEPLTDGALSELGGYLEPFLVEVSARFPAPVTRDEALLGAALTAFADAPVDVIVIEESGPGFPAVLTTELLVVPTPPDQLAEHVERSLRPGGTLVLGDGASAQPERARQAGRLLSHETDFDAAVDAQAVGGNQIGLRGPGYQLDELYLPLHGPHQVRNASVAMATVAAFLGELPTVDGELVRTALASVRLPGRLEVVRRTDAATVVLDAAASVDAVRCLAETVRAEFGFRHRMLVLAGWHGEADTLASCLAALVDHVVLLGDGGHHGLITAFTRRGVSVEHAADPAAALAAAEGLTVEPDGILVVGPDEVLGAARTELGLSPA